MTKKKKNDFLLIGVALILLGGLLIFSIATRVKGEIAYVKVSNQAVMQISLKDGSYVANNPSNVIVLTEKPEIDGFDLTTSSEVSPLEFGKTIVVYQNLFYVRGALGVVEIQYKENKIRVSKEKSPYNICSRQGYSDVAPIVCLPNFVTIEFSNDTDVIIG